MRIANYAALAGALIAVGACQADPASPDERQNENGGLWEGMLQATVSNGRVVLKNQTEQKVGYVVLEKNMAIVAMFPPCTDNCTTLVQGGEASVRYQDVPGYSPGARAAIVYWWRYDTSGRPTGAMTSVVVRL